MTAAQAYTEGWEVPGLDPAVALCVLDRDAPTEDWYRCRRTGIGGSDVSAVLGLSAYRSRFDVWVEKTETAPPEIEDDDNTAPYWGKRLEPLLREEFAARAGVTVTLPGTLRSVRWPWMTTNLDGLCSDGAIYEGKTASSYARSDWEDGQVADHAELQAQHNMAVTGAHGCWVSCLLGGQKLEIRFVERNESIIASLVAVERAFWHDYVLTNQMPPADATAAFGEALSRRFPVADEDAVAIDAAERNRLAALLAQAEAAKSYLVAEDEAKNVTKQMLGSRTHLEFYDAQGRRQEVATWKQTGNFDLKRFTAENPDVAEEFKIKVEGFDLAGFKDAHPDLYTQYRGRKLLMKKGDS